ncbi:MAG TPA: DUF5667 domain-containing protein [Patescibacteria group bacterium]|nr:DUF5667 domain-containing protein [Patescibacteria group bacterium]
MTNDERDDWGDDGGLRPQLDAYADARLRADPEARARARARVMAEARTASNARLVAASPPAAARTDAKPGGNPVRSVPRHHLVIGRFRVPAAIAATLLLAAALTVGAALAGSGPGGPFYAARLWAEELTLPTDADSRTEAHLARLEARLAEAGQAAQASNSGAVSAALEAYRETADDALGTAGEDVTRREHLAERLGRHVAVLEELVPRVPDRASEAIQAAVERTENRIAEILAKPRGRPEGTPPGRPEGTPGEQEATPKPTPRGRPEGTPPGRPKATPREQEAPPSRPEGTPGEPEAPPAP